MNDPCLLDMIHKHGVHLGHRPALVSQIGDEHGDITVIWHIPQCDSRTFVYGKDVPSSDLLGIETESELVLAIRQAVRGPRLLQIAAK